MTRILKSSLKSGFVWQFAGGFVLGAVGLFALQPPMQTDPLAAPMQAASVR